MIRDDLARLILDAAARAQQDGALPAGVSVPDPSIERPQNPDHGDYATSLPLKLARSARTSPLALAKILADRAPEHPAVARIDVAPPGFINFRLRDAWLGEQVEEVRRAGETFGASQTGAGRKVQLEFVSANPTGPIHVGNGRGAVLGTTLANLFAAAGYSVTREFYVNDAGLQIEVFARSLHARYLQALGQTAPFPEEGYQGHYMVELGQAFAAEFGDRFAGEPVADKIREMGKIGLDRMLDNIRTDLALLGVE
ncbi:MAG: arginine--tRNA ligase [Chloroflexi bacterium]|nr:arginine--tRNA ligase [Chloroflexota bacterium]